MTKGAKQLRQIFDRPNQKDIAKQLGVSEAFLSMLASGRRLPSMSVASRIQKELGIPVEAWTR